MPCSSGWATTRTRRPVITTFADYPAAVGDEVPNIEIIHHEFPSTLNPLGVKGVGEAGTIPAAAAIASAVENALVPFAVRSEKRPSHRCASSS